MSRLSGMNAEVAFNPGATSTETVSQQITVPGAKLGDFVIASFDPTDLVNLADDIVHSAIVSAPNTVTYQIRGDGTAPNLGAGTVRVKVVPYDTL